MNRICSPSARILVTGGAGFIGLEVCAQLAELGFDVRVLDNLRADVHPDPDFSLTRVGKVADSMVGDVRDADTADRALSGVDTVIHLAAKVGLGVGVADLPDYASSNDYGTACLLAAAARAEVSNFVLASSMVVYGEGVGRCPEHGDVRPSARPESWLTQGRFEPPCPICQQELLPALVNESSPTDPRNAYAASKLAQEHLATTWARETRGRLRILRYHNVYGAGLPLNTPYAGVAALWLTELRAGRAPQVFEDGQQRRDFIHVSDIAAATIAATGLTSAATAVTSDEVVRTYNVGSGQVRTIGEMATSLAAAFGAPAPMVTGRYRLGDVRHITADSTRLHRELELPTPIELPDGLAGLVAAV